MATKIMFRERKAWFLLILISSFLLLFDAKAQNEVAIGSATTKSNAILWLNGNGSQGLILPVVSNKSAVSNPDRGMIVYDDSDNKVWYRNNSTWVEVAGGTGSTANLNLAIQGNQLLLRDGTGILSTVNIAGGTQTAGAFLVFQGGSWQFATLSGDVTGANGALQVTGIRGKPVATLPATAQMLLYDPTANSNNGGWIFQPFVAAVGVTSVSGTAPVTVTNPTTTPNISLANAGITNALLADNSVTSAKIQDGTITGPDIASTTITADKLAQSGATNDQVLRWNGTNWVASTLAAGGTVTQVNTGTGLAGGPITTTGTISIAPGGVSTTELADNAVNATKLADNAVTTAKINAGAVDNTKLADNAVTSAKIANGTITGADIAATTIAGGNIANTTITADKLAQSGAAVGQVLKWNGTNWVPQADDVGTAIPTLTAGQLITHNGTTNVAVAMSGDGTFSGTGALTLANNAVTTAKIANGAVDATKLADNSVTTAKINANAVDNTKLADNAVTTIKITDNAVTTAKINANAVDNTKLADNAVTTPKVADNTITSAKILDGTITGPDIANTTITADKLAQSGATDNQVLQWNGSSWVPTSLPGAGWSITGNAGTNPATNFLGTTDLQDVVLRTNNTEHMRLTTNGNIGIGINPGIAASAASLEVSRIGVSTRIRAIGSEGNLQTLQLYGQGATTRGWSIHRFTNDDFQITKNVGLNGVTESTTVFNINFNDLKVGIGNAAPSEALDVAGNLNISAGSVFKTGGTTIMSWTPDNFFLGEGSGASITTAQFNTTLGDRALNAVTSGRANIAIGTNSQLRSTTSIDQVSVGVNTLVDNVTGTGNTTVGAGSLRSMNASDYNTAIGWHAGISFTSGSFNTYLGETADSGNGLTNATAIGSKAFVTQSNSIVLGSINGVNTATNNTNVGIGTTAPVARLDVVGNVKITDGTQAAGRVLTSDANGLASWQPAGAGSGWTLLGNAGTSDATNFIGTTDNVPFNIRVNNQRAGRIDPINLNTFYGQRSGNAIAAAGTNNVGLGYQAMQSTTIGTENTAIGYNALVNNTTAGLNTAVGKSALFTLSFNNGNTQYFPSNTAVGYHSLYSTNPTTSGNGARNTAIGYFSGESNTIGVNNVFVGYQAGEPNTSGNNNVFIGYDAGPTTGALTNAIAIGYNAKVAANNTLVLGATGADAINVGIGTTAPNQRLEVSSAANTRIRVTTTTTALQSGIEFIDGTNSWRLTTNAISDGFRIDESTDGFTTSNIRYNFTTNSFYPAGDGTQNLGISTNRWSTVFASNGTINTSDRRLKKEIHHLAYGLDEVLRLQPMTFKWSNEATDTRTHIGLMAQEVLRIIPEVVMVGNDEQQTLGLSYSELIPVLIRAIQEQEETISRLKADNEKYINGMEELSRDVENIKRALGISSIKGNP